LTMISAPVIGSTAMGRLLRHKYLISPEIEARYISHTQHPRAAFGSQGAAP
jgi:hypothetical protein